MYKELEYNSTFFKEIINTIYFGGGTPSLLDLKELEKFFNIIFKKYNITQENNLEITIECNPEDINKKKVEQYLNLGINRISLGVQSFFDDELQNMNRTHNAKQSIKAIEIISNSKITTYNIDLIFALPFSNTKRWEKNLKKAVNFKIPHLSIYGLTVERKTLFYHKLKKKEFHPVSDERFNEEFMLAHKILTSFDYNHYEISNYALNGHISKHNSNYWNSTPYIGIGPSAHSYFNNIRRFNIPNNAIYTKKINDNKKWYNEEKLNKNEMFNEYILTRLRTSKGINTNEIKQIFGMDFLKHFYNSINKKYFIIKGNNYKLSLKAMLISDKIISDLMIN